MEQITLTCKQGILRSDAERESRAKLPPDALLIAWFDRTNGTGSLEACAGRSESCVESYCGSRGAKAKVVVNDRYVFFYGPTPSDTLSRR